MGAVILSILNGLAAIPKIADYLNQAIQTIVTWWIQRQQKETLAAISDAAAFAARAENEEQRFEALAKWQAALMRGRISS